MFCCKTSSESSLLISPPDGIRTASYRSLPARHFIAVVNEEQHWIMVLWVMTPSLVARHQHFGVTHRLQLQGTLHYPTSGYPEDGSRRFFRNLVVHIQDYTALQLRISKCIFLLRRMSQISLLQYWNSTSVALLRCGNFSGSEVRRVV